VSGENAVRCKNRRNDIDHRRRFSGSFRVMCPGYGGNLGNVGNVESVSCRPYYLGDGTNPPLSALLESLTYMLYRGGSRKQQAERA
jgi:hypothetical protein